MNPSGILIRLGWPNKVLSPNARAHWRPVSAAKKNARKEAWAEATARGVRNLKGDRFRLTVTAYPPTKHTRDDDNLMASLKAHFDGIAEAMGVDDSCFHRRFDRFDHTGEVPGVLIFVEPME